MNFRIAVLILWSCAFANAQAKELVFVAGATGGTGIEAVRILKDAGYAVRGGTRDINRAKQRFGDLADWVAFDALDPALVDRILQLDDFRA